MQLQCELEEAATGEGTGLGAIWLRPDTLESLAEVNESCLSLLAEQAAARASQANALLRVVGELWRGLDAAGRRRAAACPYLLVDAGFADLMRWKWGAGPGVGDAGPAPYAAYFTVPAATEVARLVFTYAWHLARSQSAAARLLLAMPAPVAALIGRYTVRQIHTLADAHPEWLTPRWPSRVPVWRELLTAAATGEGSALQQARLHGLTLLAAEARGAASARPERTTRAP
jgi:hypothetical protein